MTFIPFEKAAVEAVLPENRAKLVFTQPDVYMHFGEIKTLYIYDDIIEDLDDKWLDQLTHWWGELDFNAPNTEHDLDKVCTEYTFIDFALLPELASLDEHTAKGTPLAWDKKELVINTNFLAGLQQAGAVDIWFDKLY
ncbi:hypothetical protein [Shewanella algae]|uniref:Uncharacterized protein n=2 Tax=Shewanella algae TaxID=38313 RepID=A0A380ACP1_9GAMM|nr:hypothetical protein [Shewanella algae]MBO2558004.1 hypothetical protein [Shewanella algae]MBO2566466.1 hypothetical protein [Shewanella algae]MBO2574940.1 hypothetical protein [Shewanella algae]MBO2608958.1 hypothetical protein [Shewanella algae]MBO2613279.1 hypothetical protein [Shewanella algae]